MLTTLNGAHDDGNWKAAYLPAIAKTTGPLDGLRGRHVLVLADIENLYCSVREWELSLQFDQLAKLLQRQFKSVELHAFFSCRAGDQGQAARCREAGWTPHPNEIQTVRRRGKLVRRANSDNVMLFWSGYLTGRESIDVVVIGSGDGDLGCDLAREIVRRDAAKSVVTLSVAGCTAERLNAEHNPFIDANLEVGLDCVEKLTTGRQRGWFPRP
ncbi:hypothetical protein NG895_02095 [Aeoliella sp. ICT_H6.2]|uniref:NYN domain-containing protein n=1 Tax=Aeoliella straminimaris TaxID=2954799 RepID=A0A9X2JEY6_9BACT|nr:hypothetical protein [Aeoliella straminimaris]MCO6042687.1 hypothetical protein [Aeoliella straminimaris]